MCEAGERVWWSWEVGCEEVEEEEGVAGWARTGVYAIDRRACGRSGRSGPGPGPAEQRMPRAVLVAAAAAAGSVAE